MYACNIFPSSLLLSGMAQAKHKFTKPSIEFLPFRPPGPILVFLDRIGTLLIIITLFLRSPGFKSVSRPPLCLTLLTMYFYHYIIIWSLLNLVMGKLFPAGGPLSRSQVPLASSSDDGHNEPYFPSPGHPVPGKVPFKGDEKTHYYTKHVNGSGDGHYRRSSCPALNILANRGYINRSGRNIGYEEIAQAARKVFNFGDDNVSPFRWLKMRELDPLIPTDHDSPHPDLRSSSKGNPH